MKISRPARWLAFAPAAVVGAGLVHYAVVGLIELLDTAPFGWPWMLLKAYGHLAMGYVFAAIGTTLAPRRKGSVVVGLVIVTVVVGGVLVFRSDLGAGPAALFALALVAGSVGFALRRRGFSEVALSEA